MTHRHRLWLLFVALILASVGFAGAAAGDKWVPTWTTAPVVRAPAPPPAAGAAADQPDFKDETIREIVHTTIGGNRVRVAISNVFGTTPLEIGAANIALRGNGSRIDQASSRKLLFGGANSITVPPGAEAVSDPADLMVPKLTDLAIDLYFSGGSAPAAYTIHNGAMQTSYVSQRGNHVGKSDFPTATLVSSWYMLGRVEVSVTEPPSVVVALGDSITDGFKSSMDSNHRWPDYLARRATDGKLSVLNVGISGNRLLADGAGVNALARLNRDVLAQPGVTHVIVMEGINDIGLSAGKQTAGGLIWAHHQLVERAHAMGLKIYGATMTPFEGAVLANRPDYWTPDGEMTRQMVNTWIRTSKDYDAVIDFDEVLREPRNPTRIQARYDSGDHLHPNDIGYQAMANAVDLKLFSTAATTTTK